MFKFIFLLFIKCNLSDQTLVKNLGKIDFSHPDDYHKFEKFKKVKTTSMLREILEAC